MNARPDGFTPRNGAGDSGQCNSVDPIVAAILVYDLHGKVQPASLRTPKYLSYDKTVHPVPAVQTVSAKYVAEQANTQSFREGNQGHQSCRQDSPKPR